MLENDVILQGNLNNQSDDYDNNSNNTDTETEDEQRNETETQDQESYVQNFYFTMNLSNGCL